MVEHGRSPIVIIIALVIVIVIVIIIVIVILTVKFWFIKMDFNLDKTYGYNNDIHKSKIIK